MKKKQKPSAQQPELSAALSALLTGGDLSPEAEVEDVKDLTEEELKAKTKRLLAEAGPSAARKLATVAKRGEDKDSVPASTAILDRIGFSKAEVEPPKSNDVLDAKQLLSALFGLGKVFGLQEAQLNELQKKESTFDPEATIKVESEEVRPVSPPLRKQLAPPVHLRRVREEAKSEAKSKKTADKARKRSR